MRGPEVGSEHGAEDAELNKNLTERLGLGGRKQVAGASGPEHCAKRTRGPSCELPRARHAWLCLLRPSYMGRSSSKRPSSSPVSSSSGSFGRDERLDRLDLCARLRTFSSRLERSPPRKLRRPSLLSLKTSSPRSLSEGRLGAKAENALRNCRSEPS